LVLRYRVKVVIMVRHPVAIWRSIQRMGWPVRFDRFGGPMFDARLAREAEPSRSTLDDQPVPT
jgi:hypothetical protein